MSLFQEIAFNEDVPVIHARRKDGVIVIATRVPLKDMLPERWGWILTLGGKGEIIEHDDIEALRDNLGRSYPKVYLGADMVSYIENWECVQWGAGYSDGKAAILKENDFPDMKQFKEDLLCEITKKYQVSQDEQAQTLQEVIEKQVKDILTSDQQKYSELHQNLQSHVDKNDIALLQYAIVQEIENTAEQVQTAIVEEATSQAAQMQGIILEKIEQQPYLSEQALSGYLDKLDRKQLEQLEALMMAMKDVQKCVAEMKDILVPMDTDDGSTNVDDSIKKLSTSAKTLSDRYMTSVISTNTRYHNTVDKQVKDSFKLTRIVLYVGAGLFILTIISFLVTLFFHSNEITLITSSVGAMLSAIATGIGGLNKVHDDAADRQLKTLANLSRSVKATHAQFMIEQVHDEMWQRTQFERLINQYLMGNEK